MLTTHNFKKLNLQNMFLILFILSIVVFIYLLYVLLKPEKF
ncbi:potassium-transporting ATPase subunit F [Ferruginibacter sp.]